MTRKTSTNTRTNKVNKPTFPCFYYPGQKNWDRHACQRTGACILETARACTPRARGCLKFFGQGSSSLHLLTLMLIFETFRHLKNLSICIDSCPLTVIWEALVSLKFHKITKEIVAWQLPCKETFFNLSSSTEHESAVWVTIDTKMTLCCMCIDIFCTAVTRTAETNTSSTQFLKVPKLPDCKYWNSIVDNYIINIGFARSLTSTEPVQVTGCYRVMVLIRNWK